MLSAAENIILFVSLHQPGLSQIKGAQNGLAEPLFKRAGKELQSLLGDGEQHNQRVPLLARCKEHASQSLTLPMTADEELRLENRA
jgi:hypothetical protein